VSHDEALEFFPGVYDRVAAETPGMFTRSRDWWEVRRLTPRPWMGAREFARVLVERDGRPEAYAIYSIQPSMEHGVSKGVVDVVEAIGASAAGTRQIWTYLLSIDWVERVHATFLAVDHALFLLLVEPRRMRFTLGEALWARLVDVGAALSMRGYAADGAVVFDVRDNFCPWNEGCWRLENGVAESTDDPPDLRLDVAELGSAYLGGFTFSALAAAGQVEELREGAIARADALFRTERAPWCPELF
jgi:predicted acetyltransferase